MLSYVLALVIGLGSLAFYLAAFFVPEVHRKSDFYLSGGGLFYALVLWVCGGRITGWVLLSQIASVTLLCSLGWQTLTLRRMLTPSEQQTPIPSQEELVSKLPGVLQPVANFLGNLLGKSKPAIPTPQTTVGTTQDTTTAQKEAILEEVQEVTEVEASPEDDTLIESPFETVAVVEQKPEVSKEEEDTIKESPSETVIEASEPPENREISKTAEPITVEFSEADTTENAETITTESSATNLKQDT
ncbi:MAG: hypothetical protein F6K47_14705 [Symploca sp. SIO2E6]|nr:hypothetical protein [Symploca sp. SIO2E6]